MYFPERLRRLLPKNKTKEELDGHYDGLDLEKGDYLAMVIAAFITFFPVLIAVMALAYGFIWLVFIR
jgi:hypothetical protein